MSQENAFARIDLAKSSLKEALLARLAQEAHNQLTDLVLFETNGQRVV